MLAYELGWVVCVCGGDGGGVWGQVRSVQVGWRGGRTIVDWVEEIKQLRVDDLDVACSGTSTQGHFVVDNNA